jgi:hypothetical protein
VRVDHRLVQLVAKIFYGTFDLTLIERSWDLAKKAMKKKAAVKKTAVKKAAPKKKAARK